MPSPALTVCRTASTPLASTEVVQAYYRPRAVCQSANCPLPLAFLAELRHTNDMENKGNEMQVYAVAAGEDYHGENMDTLKLFDCKSAAEAYAKELEGQLGVDYVEMKVLPILMHSAIS